MGCLVGLCWRVMHSGIVLRDVAVAALFHDGRIRRSYGNRRTRLLANGPGLGELVGIVVGIMLHIVAFQPIDGDAGGVGAHHDEVRRPRVGLMGDAARRRHPRLASGGPPPRGPTASYRGPPRPLGPPASPDYPTGPRPQGRGGAGGCQGWGGGEE